MDQIRDWLYIGSLRDTLDAAGLHAAGIGAMLQLAEEAPQKEIVHRYLAIRDGEPLSTHTLRSGLDFVDEQRSANKPVLIACGLGVSRSATFVIASLKEAENIGLLDALRAVSAVHRETRPHPVLWRSLCDHYGEPFSLTEMMRTCRSAGQPL